MKKVNVAFAGCGFLGLYQTGVVAAFTHHGRSFINNIGRVSGSSAGSLHAVMLACDAPLDKCIRMGLQAANKIRSNIHKVPWQNLDAEVRVGLDYILPADAHISATSKLFVSVTVLGTDVKVQNQLISEFNSRKELINILAQSCYIPLYSGFALPKQGDNWFIDGAYTDNLPLFEDYENVKVSPFCGAAAEIAPTDDSEGAFQIIYKNMPFAVTSENLKRIVRVMIPSSNEELKKLYFAGYKDGKLYLKKHGYFEAGPAPDVSYLFDEDATADY